MNHLGMQSIPEDIEALLGIVRQFAVTTAVEVGTWVGATAAALADSGCSVTCIDWFQGTKDPAEENITGNRSFDEIWRTFRENVGHRLWQSVFPIIAETTGAPWVQGPFDLAFIDADHRYENVKADLDRWVPCVRPGGIVACHDYGLWPGVKRAVDELRGADIRLNGKSLAWWRV